MYLVAMSDLLVYLGLPYRSANLADLAGVWILLTYSLLRSGPWGFVTCFLFGVGFRSPDGIWILQACLSAGSDTRCLVIVLRFFVLGV